MPGKRRKPPTVVCLAYDDWSLFEAGIASEVFGLSRPEFERPLYRFRVAQSEPGVLRSRGGVRLNADGGLGLLRSADLVIVPGWRDHRETPPEPMLAALRAAHRRGACLMSICSGAFVLAAAGVLEGRAATTHWRHCQAFRDRFPNVDLRADVLYVDEGDVITSAGSAAGIDACLHVVRLDYGVDVANRVARTMVAPAHRAGGQAQFVPAPVARDIGCAVSPVMDWARARLGQDLRVSALARRASMSERSFLRHFTAQVGMSPKRWLRRERVAAAQALLEATTGRLEQVADAAGFGSVSAMRAAFKDTVGAPPTQHRRHFSTER